MPSVLWEMGLCSNCIHPEGLVFAFFCPSPLIRSWNVRKQSSSPMEEVVEWVSLCETVRWIGAPAVLLPWYSLSFSLMPVKSLSFRLTDWWSCILNIWMQCRWPTRRSKGKSTYVSLLIFCQLLTWTPFGSLVHLPFPTGQARAKVPSTLMCHLICC